MASVSEHLDFLQLFCGELKVNLQEFMDSGHSGDGDGEVGNKRIMRPCPAGEVSSGTALPYYCTTDTIKAVETRISFPPYMPLVRLFSHEHPISVTESARPCVSKRAHLPPIWARDVSCNIFGPSRAFQNTKITRAFRLPLITWKL